MRKLPTVLNDLLFQSAVVITVKIPLKHCTDATCTVSTSEGGAEGNNMTTRFV
jgi:hypothetical protein